VQIASRVREISPSATLAISARVKELRSQGVDVVGFGAGEPDFDTPEPIKEAGIAAIREGFTKYTPASGTPELRQAVCDKLGRENSLEYTPQQVVISCGAKHTLFNIMQSLIEPGDEAVVIAPYWVSYCEMIRVAEGVPVVVRTEESKDFKVSPQALSSALTPKTKLLILNSPSNPTGTVYTREELEAVARVLRPSSACVVSDEIYEKLLYDGRSHGGILNVAPDLKDRCVYVGGVSKSYSMTGWRIGFLAGPRELADAVGRLQSHSTSNPSSMCQKAALAALTGNQQCVEDMRVEFAKRRDYIVDRLNSIPGVTCRTPAGAFYVFPNVSAFYGRSLGGIHVKDSTTFTQACLEKAQVAMVPGIAFGEDNYVRLSYATSMENIKKGLDRLEKLLEG